MRASARAEGPRAAPVIGLIQRVREASVTIDDQRVASINRGMLVLVGFQSGDRAQRLDRFIERLLNYRIFPDADGRMNLSLRDIDAQLLAVPQFTLAADTGRGNRPSFTSAASPELGRELFSDFERRLRSTWPACAFGRFGADMQVALVNDGPVTFWLELK